jgi:outer membrane protein assembly factor BamD
MSKSGILLILLFAILVSGCKSSYEKIRNSSDPVLILQAADRYYENKDYYRAQGLYEMVLTAFRGQEQAEQIYFRYAYTHFYLSEFELASHLFKTFANTFINSSRKEEADFMSVYSLYKTSPVYKLDQSATERAIDGFQLFTNSYPNSSRLDECNKLIDECRSKLELKTFEAGKLYFNMRNYQACVTSMQNLLNDFPESSNAREVRYIICHSAYLLAENSIFEKQKERLLSAQEYLQDFLRRYPNGRYVTDIKDLQKKINKKLKSTDYDRHKNTGSGNQS